MENKCRRVLRPRIGGFWRALRERVFGSEDFLRRMVNYAESGDAHRHRSTARRIKCVSFDEILSATAALHGVDPADYAMVRSNAGGRDMAAWLCRRRSGATLRELGPKFGLDGTGSVSKLVKRGDKRNLESPAWRGKAKRIEAKLGLNTQHKV